MTVNAKDAEVAVQAHGTRLFLERRSGAHSAVGYLQNVRMETRDDVSKKNKAASICAIEANGNNRVPQLTASDSLFSKDVYNANISRDPTLPAPDAPLVIFNHTVLQPALFSLSHTMLVSTLRGSLSPPHAAHRQALEARRVANHGLRATCATRLASTATQHGRRARQLALVASPQHSTAAFTITARQAATTLRGSHATMPTCVRSATLPLRRRLPSYHHRFHHPHPHQQPHQQRAYLFQRRPHRASTAR